MGWVKDWWYGPITSNWSGVIQLAPMDWDLADLESARSTLAKAGVATLTAGSNVGGPTEVTDPSKLRDLPAHEQDSFAIRALLRDGGSYYQNTYAVLGLPPNRPATFGIGGSMGGFDGSAAVMQLLSELEETWKRRSHRRLSTRQKWRHVLELGAVSGAALLIWALVALWKISPAAGAALFVTGFGVYVLIGRAVLAKIGADNTFSESDCVYVRPFLRSQTERERHASRQRVVEIVVSGAIGAAVGAFLPIVVAKLWP